jgi:hypothetical protein
MLLFHQVHIGFIDDNLDGETHDIVEEETAGSMVQTFGPRVLQYALKSMRYTLIFVLFMFRNHADFADFVRVVNYH